MSSAVENTCPALVGIVVFFLINLVITPPSVSIPNDSGVTSNNNTSVVSPPITAPCIAAPAATASSGFTSLRGSCPKYSLTASCTLGIRVCPPTRITSDMSSRLTPLSFTATLQGSIERLIKSSTRLSNLARVIFTFKCLGPVSSDVM